jgi:hypothetical protein
MARLGGHETSSLEAAISRRKSGWHCGAFGSSVYSAHQLLPQNLIETHSESISTWHLDSLLAICTTLLS